MTIRVALRHKTHYKYDRPVNMGPHILRLRPAVHSRTPILGYSLRVTPAKHSSTGSRTPSATSWPGWCSRRSPPTSTSRWK